jgi:hypothetical protein
MSDPSSDMALSVIRFHETRSSIVNGFFSCGNACSAIISISRNAKFLFIGKKICSWLKNNILLMPQYMFYKPPGRPAQLIQAFFLILIFLPGRGDCPARNRSFPCPRVQGINPLSAKT